MTVLFCADESFRDHDSGPGHPERSARVDAAAAGMEAHHLEEMTLPLAPRDATDEELERVHRSDHVQRVERFCELGGGQIDADTVVGLRSAQLARQGSGTLLAAVQRLEHGEASAAFVVARPPGHHATADRAMGFCLYNHVAVVAAALAATGRRVAVVDIDAHHGNGTQDIFFDRGDVFYVSWHQSPHYPYSGRAEEVGRGAGHGATLNVPLPAGATGDVYRRSIADLVAPALDDWDVEWLLVSAGFDTHRADPLCDLALSSGDVADIVTDLCSLVPEGRVAALLEGGYDLRAVADCTAATVAALAGVRLHPEEPTSGGPGGHFVDAAIRARQQTLGAGT